MFSMQRDYTSSCLDDVDNNICTTSKSSSVQTTCSLRILLVISQDVKALYIAQNTASVVS